MDQFGRRRWAGLVLAVLAVALGLSSPYRNLASLPPAIRIAAGSVQDLPLRLPLALSVRAADDGLLRLGEIDAADGWSGAAWEEPPALEAMGQGSTSLELRLFGWLPVRRVAVDVVAPVHLLPGGQAIGVKVEAAGVMVVGFASFVTDDGVLTEPGREAGVVLGDLITAVNGKPAGSENTVAQLIDAAGRDGEQVELTLVRDGEERTATLQPMLDGESGTYRIGLYVRGGAAGVGTLTFYDPDSGRFGALGHVISDADTGRPIAVQHGEIVRASISGIDKGERSRPGEKIGVLDQQPIGTIERNTPFGIVGQANEPLQHELYEQAIPVAYAAQVQPGPAEILTVVDGQKVERFAVEIQRVVRQPRPDGKSMVIRITDERLLERTGGIVQGMSGSPIIQNGHLIGAVTHVFVNDPTRGYGVFIEWMLQEGGILTNSPEPGQLGRVPPFFGQQWPDAVVAGRSLATGLAIRVDHFLAVASQGEEDYGTAPRIPISDSEILGPA